MCFSVEYYRDEMVKKLVGQGGLVILIVTNDSIKLEQMVEKVYP